MMAGRWVPLAVVPKWVGFGKVLAAFCGDGCWWVISKVNVLCPLLRVLFFWA